MKLLNNFVAILALIGFSLTVKASELKKRHFDQEMTSITDALLSTHEDLDLDVLSHEKIKLDESVSSVDLLEI